MKKNWLIFTLKVVKYVIVAALGALGASAANVTFSF